MDILQIKYLLTKREFKSFTLPLVLIVIVLLFFFTQEIMMVNSKRFVLNKSMIEKDLLSDLTLMGNKILEKSLVQYGTGNLLGSGSARETIALNPKLYIDMNGDGTVDSLLIYTFVNMSATKIEFALTAYRLKRSECGNINHPLLTMNMEPTSIRKIKILSNLYSTDTQMSEYIQFTLKTVDLVYVVDKLGLIKKLNLVAND